MNGRDIDDAPTLVVMKSSSLFTTDGMTACNASPTWKK
jgi:hypothetical protein